jgi:serine phosphatase RsbU (regulator of sigma subunit)
VVTYRSGDAAKPSGAVPRRPYRRIPHDSPLRFRAMARGAPVMDEARHEPAAVAHTRPAAELRPVAGTRRGRGPHSGALAVLLIGLLITASLSIGAQRLNDSNEERLLHQRVREAAAVVSAAIPDLQTPLATAAVLAAETGGAPGPFRQVMGPMVGSSGRFVTASLWSVSPTSIQRRVTVGGVPELATESASKVAAVLRPPATAGTIVINDLLASRDRRLGYGYAAPGAGTHYVVYVESSLPAGRRARVDTNSAFADLDYALFVGPKPDASHLLASSTGGVLLSGRRASGVVTFGSTVVLLVMKARGELGGNLLARLPWILALGGLVLTLAGGFLVERLLRRRDDAEALARENVELYREQRDNTLALQHGLLPETLPDVPGLELAARYVAGADGIDIGGDWYDVVTLDDGRIVFVVGDVSGHGLRAATTMAELRYAFRAYAVQGDAPDAMLAKVSRLVSVARDGHFATAVCGVIEVGGHRMTFANAGHPEPLLVSTDAAGFVSAPIGAPLGVESRSPYSAATVAIPMGATVLAYTDGLVERRGEHLDVGRERLRIGALDHDGSLADRLARILTHSIPSGSSDDTAILGLRWLG